MSELSNFVYGTAGNDSISFSGTGSTVINAGEGNDTIHNSGNATTIYAGDGNDIVYAGTNNFVDGGNGNDTIAGGTGTNHFIGGAGDDRINYQSASNNTIDGGEGNDQIFVQSSYGNGTFANVITGGQGNDAIQSGASADTYLFNRGDGIDTIKDYAYNVSNAPVGEDAIIFGEGIQAADLTYSRHNNDLIVKIIDPNNPNANDQITIQNWYADSRYQIEQFIFTDGTRLAASEVSELSNFVYGTAGNDSISFSGTGSTVINAGEGNDTIHNSGNATTIYAGDGNDIVYAGTNNFVDGGNGNDTIAGGTGTNHFIGGAGDDRINYQSASNNTIDGGEGNDQIFVQSSYGNGTFANVITGGQGNDAIQSGASADTYLFNRGDGIDTIKDYAYNVSNAPVGEDAIIFGEGIQAADLTYSRHNNDLIVKIIDPNNPSANDQITIQNWFYDNRYQLEQFVFADGTVLDIAEITRRSAPDYVPEPLMANVVSAANTEAIVAAHALFSAESSLLGGMNLSAATFVPSWAALAGNAAGNAALLNTDDAGSTLGEVEIAETAEVAEASEAGAVSVPETNAWALTHALLDSHLAASNSAALGGELASQYGMGAIGDLSAMGTNATQAGMDETNPVSGMQALRPKTALQEGLTLA